jgi:adenosylmethionine---8-amino-7-oxononanoate aminotransferase
MAIQKMKINDYIIKDKNHIWHPFTQHKTCSSPLFIQKGEGSYLFDQDNNKLFDAISSWWVNIHGHSHPDICESIYQQAKQLEHVLFADVVHEKAILLAEKLLSVLPNSFQKVFYSDNGSTSVEVAIKMAIQYWFNRKENKKKIIVFKHSYHGDTYGAMSLADRNEFNKPFWSMLFPVIFINPPLKHRRHNSIEELKTILEQNKDIAAFVFEPLVQGAGGMLMQESKVLDKMISLANKNDIICIADEVMTGFGRTGKIFAIDHLEHKPDIICLSKGITGGFLPLSTTITSNKIYEAFLDNDKSKALLHGHSYTANPIACAAACTSFDILNSPQTLKQIEQISIWHQNFVFELKKSKFSQTFTNIRQQGTILALEFRTSGKSGYFNNLKEKIVKYFFSKKILIRPLGNTLYFLPPYCSSHKDLQNVYNTTFDFIKDEL